MTPNRIPQFARARRGANRGPRYVLGYRVAVPRSTPLRANPARNGDPGCAGLGCHRLKFVATAAGFVRRGTAGPSTPAEAVGRDDNSRESAGCARDDSDKGDVTA